MKFRIGKIQFSTEEIIQLTISLIILSFAFSLILYRDQISGLSNYSLKFFINSLIIVGLAFILHEELGHKIVAQHYGYWAEYRAWPTGLFLALALAILSGGTFVFAAPGAVMISANTLFSNINKERMGKIAIAGAVVNIILSLVFILLYYLFGLSLFIMAAQVNIWLALFNMIPIGMLDGAKVFRWDRRIWGIMLIISSVLLFSVSAIGTI